MQFKYNYTPLGKEKLPLVDIIITNPVNKLKVSYPSLVDSGAFMSVFHNEVAYALGIDLSSIKEQVAFAGVGEVKRTLTGKLYVVDLMVSDRGNSHKFDAPVLFSDDLNPNGYPILGRQGFFNNFKNIIFSSTRSKVILTV